MINFANLEAVKYPPELLPDAAYFNPTAGNDATVLNLTRLPANMLVRIRDVAADRGGAGTLAELRFKADSETFNVHNAAIPNFEATKYNLIASKSARILVHAIDDLTGDNYKVWHGLQCWRATIADKLALGIPLNAEENAINSELGISKTVERGTLPVWDISRLLMYEYRVIYKQIHTLYQTLPITGLAVDTIRPNKLGQEFVVLESVSCAVTAVADTVTLNIWRDDDGSSSSPSITLQCASMDLSFDIPCFIPALRELNIRLEAGAQQLNYTMRYTYGVYKLSNILRMRWGILTKEDNPDLWKRVKGGIV